MCIRDSLNIFLPTGLITPSKPAGITTLAPNFTGSIPSFDPRGIVAKSWAIEVVPPAAPEYNALLT